MSVTMQRTLGVAVLLAALPAAAATGVSVTVSRYDTPLDVTKAVAFNGGDITDTEQQSDWRVVGAEEFVDVSYRFTPWLNVFVGMGSTRPTVVSVDPTDDRTSITFDDSFAYGLGVEFSGAAGPLGWTAGLAYSAVPVTQFSDATGVNRRDNSFEASNLSVMAAVSWQMLHVGLKHRTQTVQFDQTRLDTGATRTTDFEAENPLGIIIGATIEGGASHASLSLELLSSTKLSLTVGYRF